MSPMAAPAGPSAEDPILDADGPSDEMVAKLIASLDSVTIARPAAVQVLTTVDNPNADAHRVAAAVELDPGFAAQLIRLANSAYYGMSGRVGNTSFAVTVIGFSAIRSMAALIATGLDTAGSAGPAGFWEHAAATAAACSNLAPRFGLVTGDAFAAGLLHDLGIALLTAFDRDGHAELVAGAGRDGAQLDSAERARFGMGHDDAAAHVLSAWRFPPQFIEAIGTHHQDDAATEPLALATRAADLLADVASGTPAEDAKARIEELCGTAMGADEWVPLVDATRERTTEIIASLRVH